MDSLACHAVLDRLLVPGAFFAKPELTLRVEHQPSERRRWELFKGELVPPEQTREEASFSTWKVHAELPDYPSLGPTLCILVTEDQQCLFVTRGFPVQGFSAFGEGNVIKTRAATLWREELVGTVHRTAGTLDLSQVPTFMRAACRGTSRLPITSVESPLPLHSLGLFTYLESPAPAPLRTLDDWLVHTFPNSATPHAPAVEFALRIATGHEVGRIAAALIEGLQPAGPDAAESCRVLFNALFHGMVLTPECGLIGRLLQLIEILHPQVDMRRTVQSYLRQLGRHLTAFDLVRFHNQGANYPDAFLLDGLRQLLRKLRPHSADRSYLRALRTACVLRVEMEGVPVPERPTSPGEQQRIWPAMLPKVPEEQLAPEGRSRLLFSDNPLSAGLTDAEKWDLRQSFTAEDAPQLLLELGRATFLDRPLGIFKIWKNWHRDETPLLGYHAFSKQRAALRLEAAQKAGWLSTTDLETLRAELQAFAPPGIAAIDLPLPQQRPAVVCLEDARVASDDFVIFGITNSGWLTLQTCLDFTQVVNYEDDLAAFLYRPQLFIRSPRRRLFVEPRAVFTLYDSGGQPRLELGLPAEVRPQEVDYCSRGLLELPACGFVVLHAWKTTRAELAMPTAPLTVPCKF